MNTELLFAIRDDKRIPSGYAKAVLFALVSRGENAYPSYAQLMSDAGIGSRNTLRKVLDNLEKLGYLKVSKAKWDTNQYANNRYEVVHPSQVSDSIRGSEIQVSDLTVPSITFDNSQVSDLTPPSINIDTLKVNIKTKEEKESLNLNNGLRPNSPIILESKKTKVQKNWKDSSLTCSKCNFTAGNAWVLSQHTGMCLTPEEEAKRKADADKSWTKFFDAEEDASNKPVEGSQSPSYPPMVGSTPPY